MLKTPPFVFLIRSLLLCVLPLLPATSISGMLVYSNNLSNAPGPEWSHRTISITPFDKIPFLGEFNNGMVTLSLSNLPPHTEIDLSFHFYLLRTWDGTTGTPTEEWLLRVQNGQTLLRTSFSAFAGSASAMQAFPAFSGQGNFPANTGASRAAKLGYSTVYQGRFLNRDAVYPLNFRFAHTSETLRIEFQGLNLESIDNESWGLGDVVVLAESVPSTAPPRITQQPRNQSVPLGGSAMFNVVATTNAPLTYQWRFKGLDLPGKTKPYLVLTSITSTQAGLYEILVTSTNGATLSEPARLTLGFPSMDPPRIETISQTEGKVVLGWDSLAADAALQGTTALEQEETVWSLVNADTRISPAQNLASVFPDQDKTLFRLASNPGLSDFWEGKAEWIEDSAVVKGELPFHSARMLRADNTILAYYPAEYRQAGGRINISIRRAHSSDGLNWVYDGVALDIGSAARWTFESRQQKDIFHGTGHFRTNGWIGIAGQDNAGFLISGQVSTTLPLGVNTAGFVLSIENNQGPDDVVATLDVYDYATSRVLTEGNVRRSAFPTSNDPYLFRLPFTNQTGMRLNFDVWFYGTATILSEKVLIAQGKSPWWDSQGVSSPALWKDGAVYYMAYEGSSDEFFAEGDIGLGTSTDGMFFTRQSPNPILRHDSAHSRESKRIGSPSLIKKDGLWYLFYEGADGQTSSLSVATGMTLTTLARHSGNPILRPTSAAWDSGGVGKPSSIIQEGSYFYIAYQGRSAGDRRWEIGLARSSNLFDWEKHTSNPIAPKLLSESSTQSPELMKLGGTWYLYVTAADSSIRRYKLVSKPTSRHSVW